MKAVKIIVAIIISLFLIAAEGLLGGLFAVDQALSEESIRESAEKTEIVSQLVDEALNENTINMAGEYGEMIKAVFKTEAMETFFTDYMVSAINTTVYGKPYKEVADDELMEAFSQGVDEVNEKGDITISTMEEELLKQAMMQKIPDLTASLNSNLSAYEATESEATEDVFAANNDIQLLMSTGVRVVVIIVCIIFLIVLAMLFWKSKLGFIWAAVVTAMVTLAYGIFALAGTEYIIDYLTVPADQFALDLMAKGFQAVAIAGTVVTLILIVSCLVLRRFRRKGTLSI